MVNAWSGLYWKLYSNSLVIKVKSPFEQWYYNALVPHKHFVPMESLEHVHDVWRYLKTHECKKIVQESTSFIKTVTMDFALNEYKIW